MKSATVAYFKRSHFILGSVRTWRGLKRDVLVLSWLAKRNGQIAAYLKTPGPKKLQIGTSNNVLEGWLNTDIEPRHQTVTYLDTTRRLPFDDGAFDYILAEHMIEHIEHSAAEFMLRECFRVLKPGGRLRVATPDLGVLLALRSPEKTLDQERYIDWCSQRFAPNAKECREVFVINNAVRAWGHCFLYDAETLLSALRASGFHDVKFYKPGISDDPNLRGLESHGKEIGDEGINQFETMVAECRKD